MKESLISIKEYAVKNILRFLLLAVILTLCFAMRYAAMGKYVVYLKDSTQVIAGESYFASNYLKEFSDGHDGTGNIEEIQNFSISSWDKKHFTLSIDLQNYDNSLKVNKSSQNIFVYVVADLVNENGQNMWDTIKNDNPGLELTTTFKNNNGDTVNEDGYYTDAAFGMQKVILLKGGGIDSKKAVVSISTGDELRATKITQNFYIRVRTYMVPFDEYNKINFTGADSDRHVLTDSEGIFYHQLAGAFFLGTIDADAVIDQEIEDTGLRIVAQASCSMRNVTTVKIRLYYNASMLEPLATVSYTNVTSVLPSITLTLSTSLFSSFLYPAISGYTTALVVLMSVFS